MGHPAATASNPASVIGVRRCFDEVAGCWGRAYGNFKLPEPGVSLSPRFIGLSVIGSSSQPFTPGEVLRQSAAGSGSATRAIGPVGSRGGRPSPPRAARGDICTVVPKQHIPVVDVDGLAAAADCGGKIVAALPQFRARCPRRPAQRPPESGQRHHQEHAYEDSCHVDDGPIYMRASVRAAN